MSVEKEVKMLKNVVSDLIGILGKMSVSIEAARSDSHETNYRMEEVIGRLRQMEYRSRGLQRTDPRRVPPERWEPYPHPIEWKAEYDPRDMVVKYGQSVEIPRELIERVEFTPA